MPDIRRGASDLRGRRRSATRGQRSPQPRAISSSNLSEPQPTASVTNRRKPGRTSAAERRIHVGDVAPRLASAITPTSRYFPPKHLYRLEFGCRIPSNADPNRLHATFIRTSPFAQIRNRCSTRNVSPSRFGSSLGPIGQNLPIDLGYFTSGNHFVLRTVSV